MSDATEAGSGRGLGCGVQGGEARRGCASERICGATRGVERRGETRTGEGKVFDALRVLRGRGNWMKAGEGGFPGLDGGIRIQIFEGERG